MALSYDNLIKEDLLLNNDLLVMVWDPANSRFMVGHYFRERDQFSRCEPFKERRDADQYFVSTATRLNTLAKLDIEHTSKDFFCESEPVKGKSVGLSCTYHFDTEMTMDEAEELIEREEFFNPDNGRRLIRVRFPMKYSEQYGKYVFYEAAE